MHDEVTDRCGLRRVFQSIAAGVEITEPTWQFLILSVRQRARATIGVIGEIARKMRLVENGDIDLTAANSIGEIGGAKRNERDVLARQPGLLERREDERLTAGSLAIGDALAAKIRERRNRQTRPHGKFVVRLRRDARCDDRYRLACGLGLDRGRVTDLSQIQCVSPECLKNGRPTQEIGVSDFTGEACSPDAIMSVCSSSFWSATVRAVPFDTVGNDCARAPPG